MTTGLSAFLGYFSHDLLRSAFHSLGKWTRRTANQRTRIMPWISPMNSSSQEGSNTSLTILPSPRLSACAMSSFECGIANVIGKSKLNRSGQPTLSENATTSALTKFSPLCVKAMLTAAKGINVFPTLRLVGLDLLAEILYVPIKVSMLVHSSRINYEKQ